jgi:RimJ/RimL family protein N-acetyltransferase
MPMTDDFLVTKRLRLRPWQDEHFAAFAALHMDLATMADLGGPISNLEAREKFDRYRAAWRVHGFGRFAVERPDGEFLGYAGVMARPSPDHPLGPHVEIGWRLRSDSWGCGYATESARAALDHTRIEHGVRGIVAYTAEDNLRSQSVMIKLGLRRDTSLDFDWDIAANRRWSGLVWVVD